MGGGARRRSGWAGARRSTHTGWWLVRCRGCEGCRAVAAQRMGGCYRAVQTDSANQHAAAPCSAHHGRLGGQEQVEDAGDDGTDGEAGGQDEDDGVTQRLDALGAVQARPAGQGGGGTVRQRCTRWWWWQTARSRGAVNMRGWCGAWTAGSWCACHGRPGGQPLFRPAKPQATSRATSQPRRGAHHSAVLAHCG